MTQKTWSDCHNSPIVGLVREGIWYCCACGKPCKTHEGEWSEPVAQEPAQSQPENPHPHLKRNNYVTGELECSIDCYPCAFEAGKASVARPDKEAIKAEMFRAGLSDDETTDQLAAAVVALIEGRRK